MPINENMVQDIVQEVLAKMQIQETPTGKHGVFKDMNEAIEAAKTAQRTVRKMSMDQREKIISIIRKKILERTQRPWHAWEWKKPEMGNVGDETAENIVWWLKKHQEQRILPPQHGQETED